MHKSRYNINVSINKKIILCLVCIFISTFKVAATSLFIDVGLDRAQSISALQNADTNSTVTDAIKHIKVDSSLSLMAHVVANFSRASEDLLYIPHLKSIQNPTNQSLKLSALLESIYKPPKA